MISPASFNYYLECMQQSSDLYEKSLDITPFADLTPLNESWDLLNEVSEGFLITD